MPEKSSSLRITLEDLNDKSIFINWDNEERKYFFTKLLKIITIPEFSKSINFDVTLLYDIKNGRIKPSGYVYCSILRLLEITTHLTELSISSRNYKPVKIINCYINPELIGLIHSDGLMRVYGKSVHFGFYNKNEELVNRFCKLVLSTFNCEIRIRRDKRDDTIYVHPPSIVARILAKKIGWKINCFDMPTLNLSEISLYIRGVFDGDGTVYLYKNKYILPTIKITTQHNAHAIQIKELLLKIGIKSRICCEERKGNKWCNIVITRQKDFIKFADIVGSSHPKKKRRLQEIKSLLQIR